jgi:hypothetical protein
LINSLIKKENGINPFLTVMNFKISFKTWLKFARLELNDIVRRNSGKLSIDESKKFEVEIDVEHLSEYTSEEDKFSDADSSNHRGSVDNHSESDKDTSFKR